MLKADRCIYIPKEHILNTSTSHPLRIFFSSQLWAIPSLSSSEQLLTHRR